MANYDYLNNVEQLSSLRETLTSNSSDQTPWIRCITYGRNLESLVRYVYSIKFPNFRAASTELIRLIKDKNFKNLLINSDNYNKLHFVYLAGSNAAFDHEIDKETADLALENLKEITYLLFESISEFSNEQKEMFEYKVPSNLNISEATTRKLYIDVNLKNAGYKINKDVDNLGHGHPVAEHVCVEIEVHDLPNQAIGYVDYVIYNRVGLPIAVIEAKKTSLSEEVGSQQARDYADALKKNLNLPYRPIIYYTNGYVIKIQDRLGYPAREVSNFASLKDLELLIKRQFPGDEDKRKPIVDKVVDVNIIDRSKLIEAVKEMIDSMNTDGKLRRKGLLVLPCGVGKTRTAVALSKILLKNEWVQNILFLADRNNLVSNALKPFSRYIDGDVSDISAENPDRNLNARVCICTYNSMINFLNKPKKDFSVGHFDLIFVDEAHRSLFNVYKAIFDYFDSFLIGLTATPSKALDRSTYDILDLRIDEPTFEVKFEEAVNLRYLVSYKAFDKTPDILRNGVKYDDLTDAEKAEFEELFGGPDGEDGTREVSGSAFGRTISAAGYVINNNTIDQMFVDLFTNGLRVDNGNKIGKTLIFARDHKHAEMIVERFKIHYGYLGDDFCQVIDNQINKNKTRQDNFAKKDSNPQIVVSVDMMDTGVDIPEIVNLVFFKKVLSRIKFDQMWGRGTRTCKGLHVITPSRDYFEGRTSDDTRSDLVDKQGFFVFDYCGNFEYFGDHPDGNDPSTTLNLNQKQYSLYLDMLVLMQTIEYQEQEIFRNYYNNLKIKLVDKIAKLVTDRIDVHGKLFFVDKYKDIASFENLTPRNVYEIKTNLLKLIEQDTVDDTGSKSLSYLISIIQLSLLDSRVDSLKQQKKLQRTAKKLLTKASIQAIYDKKDLLKEIARDDYYTSLDFFKLESLKEEIGPLIKYLRGEEEIVLISNFNDRIETKERDSDFNFDDYKTFREKIIDYLHKHFGELESVRKIINLEPLSEDDLKELQDVLDSLKKPEDERLFTSSDELIIFIRKIIGLDKETIDKKCSEFINKNEFSKEQRQLINLIIDFAIRNGNITGDDIVNSEPFSSLDIQEIFENNIAPIKAIVNLFNNSLQIQ